MKSSKKNINPITPIDWDTLNQHLLGRPIGEAIVIATKLQIDKLNEIVVRFNELIQ